MNNVNASFRQNNDPVRLTYDLPDVDRVFKIETSKSGLSNNRKLGSLRQRKKVWIAKKEKNALKKP